MIFKLRTAVYPPRMAPIGSKLCQNAFQVIPDVSFFDAGFFFSKFLQTLTVRLPPRMAPIDLKLGQNAFQVIPELSLFDVEDRKIFGFFSHDHFVLARTHVSWAKTHVFFAKDTCVFGQRRMRPGPGFVHRRPQI